MKVVIAGAGAVGTHLSKLLSTEHHDCVLIDDDEDRLGGMDSNYDIMAVNASPTSIKTLKDAGVAPELIDYVNTHGTSTPLGDVTEVKAIQRVFGEHVYEMNLDSTKSMTGHLIGATGAVEAMACIMALKDGIIPPTINHDPEDADEEIDYRINFTFDKAQKRNIRYALSNTFGFGGHNACLIFKKWED